MKYLIDKKTKIVCTIGPASQDKETMKKLLASGMSCMRLNFSHGGEFHDSVRQYIDRSVHRVPLRRYSRFSAKTGAFWISGLVCRHHRCGRGESDVHFERPGDAAYILSEK